MKVYVFGHYHTKNFGDILLRDIFVENIRKNCNVEEVNTIDVSTWHPLSAFNKVKYLLNAIIHNDVFIYGGGGYLNCDSGKLSWMKLLRYFIPTLVIKLLGKKYAIFGVGVGPNLYSVGCSMVRFIINNAEVVNIRDADSIKLLRGIGVKKEITKTADAAFSLSFNERYDLKPRTIDKKTIAMHLMLREGEKDKVNSLVETVIDKYANTHNILFFSDNGTLGKEKCYFKNIIINNNIEIHENLNCQQVVDVLNRSDIVYTTKLHISIVSYMMNKRVYGLYRHKKTQAFYEMIDEVDNSCFIDKVDKSIIDKWTNDVDLLTNYNLEIKSELMNLANTNFENLYEFLKNEKKN